jgi:dTDP-L-rhamnose 4-epimerase
MAETILVTGGAGFIGCHVGKELLRRGHRVVAFDNLTPQVHGARARPELLDPDIRLIVGDVRDAAAVRQVLEGVDSVIHLAAEVGVGQSMYEVERYTSANDVGTAVLFEQLIARPVRRVVTASSMSIYGEGLYRDGAGRTVQDAVRTGLRDGQPRWNPLDAEGNELVALPTPEWKQPSLVSVYALNKFVQEQTTHIVAAPYGIESVCLRLFNVYGPGQALSNPYTGVLAIFGSRLRNGERPRVFEDGEQRRDFVHVRDVARAFAIALEAPGVSGQTFNVGSGEHRSVKQIAVELAQAMGKNRIEPEITFKARVGDIRHCFADVAKAATGLGFRASEDFSASLAELADWVGAQEAQDRVDHALSELQARGLVS